jgi:hypothetical protein
MYIGKAVHRSSDGHLDSLRRNFCSVETCVITRHFRRGNSELAEAACHMAGDTRHPPLDVEDGDLTDDLALARQFGGVEEGWSANARTAGQRGRPKVVDADAYRRNYAQARNNCLSLHRAASFRRAGTTTGTTTRATTKGAPARIL